MKKENGMTAPVDRERAALREAEWTLANLMPILKTVVARGGYLGCDPEATLATVRAALASDPRPNVHGYECGELDGEEVKPGDVCAGNCAAAALASEPSGEREQIKALREERDLVAMYYRRRVWMNHGCTPGFVYGDDGEMQCSARGCPVIDFRRLSIQEIERRLYERALASATKLNDEPKHVCGLSGYNGMLDPPCPGCEARHAPKPPAPPSVEIPRDFTPAPPEVKPHAFVTARCFPALGVGLCKEYVQSGPAVAICNRPSTHSIHDGFPPVAENPRESVEDCDESIHSEACVKRMYAQAGVAPPSPRKVALPLGHEFMTAPKSTNLANFGMCGYITRFLGPPRHRPEYCGKPEAAHAPTPGPEPSR